MQVKIYLISCLVIVFLFLLVYYFYIKKNCKTIKIKNNLTLFTNFCKNGTIDIIYSCYGESRFPIIRVCNLEKGRYLAILIYDLNTSPRFYHLFMYNIVIKSNCMNLTKPTGYLGINSGMTIGYYPFCPPRGSIHYYIVEVFEYKKPIVKNKILDKYYMNYLYSSNLIAYGTRTCKFFIEM